MRRVGEGLGTAGAGAALAWLAGLLVDSLLGEPALALGAAVSGGVNGAFGGFRGVYAWRTGAGWFAFASDSTWGLLGTTLGNILNVLNLFPRGSGYRPDFSQRRNRHVYEGGVALQRRFAFTLGCVTSNAGTRSGRPLEQRLGLIDLHEDLHIWQNRWFGAVYQAIYVVWAFGGAFVGVFAWLFRRERPRLNSMVQTAAYYDNPFEYWAYKRQGYWHDNAAEPSLKWRG